MERNTKVIVVAAIAVAVVAAVTLLITMRTEESSNEQTFEKCVLVLGSAGLFCGEIAVARASDDELGRFERGALQAILQAQGKEAILLIRSEVPYGWFKSLFQQLHRAGIGELRVHLESSVCSGKAEDGRATKLVTSRNAVRSRTFIGNIKPRSVADFEDQASIVRVQPFGIVFDFRGVRVGPVADCDKELFTYCEPGAEPKTFLEEFSKLRRAVQQDEEDELGMAERYDRRRVAASKLARQQYPFETMRGQLGNYWPGVQLEVLDEMPMTVVLETMDALEYARSDEKPGGYAQNLANSLERRCQAPGKGVMGVIVLAFSDEQGVVLSEIPQK